MSEADQLDKLCWKLAKEDFERRSAEFGGAPSWEQLTDGQRNSLWRLAQGRLASLVTDMLPPAPAYKLVGFDLAAAESRLTEALDPAEARLAVVAWRKAYPELTRIIDGRVLTSDDVRPAPRRQEFEGTFTPPALAAEEKTHD